MSLTKGGFVLKPIISRFLLKPLPYLKNQKGFSTLEITIGTLILITIICAVTDFSKTTAADSSVSALANYVAETISEQGGLNTTAPASYKGSYTTSATLLSNINRSMDSIGIPDTHWTLYLQAPGSSDFIEVKPTTDTGTFPYKSEVTILLTYQNRFSLLNNALPGNLPDLNRQLSRRAVTTYFERNSSDIGFD